MNETPKRHILWRKDVIWCIDRQNRSTGATCVRDKETKKEKKDQERNMTVANWVYAETTHVVGSKWNFAWRMVFGVVLRFEFHQNRLSGFGAVGGGSKFALSHWLGHSLAYTTACTTIVTSRDRTVSYPHAGGAAVLTVTTELWSSVASLKIVHDVIIWGRCTKLNSEPVIVSSTPPLYNISLNMHWHIRIVVHTHIQTMKPLNPSQCVVL